MKLGCLWERGESPTKEDRWAIMGVLPELEEALFVGVSVMAESPIFDAMLRGKNRLLC